MDRSEMINMGYHWILSMALRYRITPDCESGIHKHQLSKMSTILSSILVSGDVLDAVALIQLETKQVLRSSI